MIQMKIVISDEHYQYLQERAQNQKTSLERVLSAMIEADLEWQHKLESDPMRSLFGQINDTFSTKDIDLVVYDID